MAWCDYDDVYSVTGWSTTDIASADVTILIGFAQRAVLKEVTTHYYSEQARGDIDGTHTHFRVWHPPIGDRDFSHTVDESDITVYAVEMDDDTGFPISTEHTVSDVYSRDGRFRLSTAPSANVDFVEVDYVHWRGDIDQELLKLATAYLTAAIICYYKTGPMSLNAFKGKISDLFQLDVSKGLTALQEEALKFYNLYKSVLYLCQDPADMIIRVEGAERKLTRSTRELAEELGYA